MYKVNLPNPEPLDLKAGMWRRKFNTTDSKSRPSTCAAAVKTSGHMTFPNLFVLLKVACTMPLTSHECEQSCSVLRGLSNYVAATMGQDHLASCTALHSL